jgi:hypothetical protein
MRSLVVGLLLLCSCMRGPVLYPDHLVLEGSPPLIKRAIFSNFYQLNAPKKLDVSIENMPKHDKARSVVDISAEMAERLSIEGVTSEARSGFSPLDLNAGEVLISGVFVKHGQGKRVGRVYAVVATIAVGWFLYAIAQVLPVANVYTIECRHEYFIEVIGPDGKPLFQKEGEIIAEYTTNFVTSRSGKCQAPNKKAVELIKKNITQDLADYFITKAPPQTLPSTQPASTSAPSSL